jgi:hypothetical protein
LSFLIGNYCKWFTPFIQRGKDIVDKIFFTEGAWLLTDVHINNQYSMIWSAENPNTFHKRTLHSLEIWVWCEILRPHIRRRADSGNFSKYNCSAMRAGVSWQITRSPPPKKSWKWCGRCYICPTAKDRKQIRNVGLALNGCAGTTLSRQFK